MEKYFLLLVPIILLIGAILENRDIKKSYE